jgi:protein tyrosine phosphatase (PTP) superfamily phosphohydrolase (DUF442 family)
MADQGTISRRRLSLRTIWHWLLIALATLPAFWHVLAFETDRDPEFPMVDRQTYNAFPPSAYRLAEPGDTIDRVALYMSAAAIVFASGGMIRTKLRASLWPTALVIGLAAFWHASTPGPTFDGWHGLGWRSLFHPQTPAWERALILLAAVGLGLVVVTNIRAYLQSKKGLTASAQIQRLLGFAVIGLIARQIEIPGVGPTGYWPRWAFVWGLMAFNFALIHALAGQGVPNWRFAVRWTLVSAVPWAVLAYFGISLAWFHRPLERLREVDQGKLYISAMPTYQGLQVAYDRHNFKTIINIFPEDTYQRSPRLPDEHRFVKEHGIRYVEASAADNDSDEFLDMCLNIVQDPANWPVLLHCHGSMDRSPGWMGIYRFVVQGRSLESIFQEIEGHRGYRPKATITLLYNRVLEPRAPERYRADPLTPTLQANAHGVRIFPKPLRKADVTRKGEPIKRP